MQHRRTAQAVEVRRPELVRLVRLARLARLGQAEHLELLQGAWGQGSELGTTESVLEGFKRIFYPKQGAL